MTESNAIKCAELCVKASRMLLTMAKQFNQVEANGKNKSGESVSKREVIGALTHVLDTIHKIACITDPSIEAEFKLRKANKPKHSFFDRSKKEPEYISGSAFYDRKTNDLHFTCKRDEIPYGAIQEIVQRMGITEANVSFSDD